MDCLSPHLRSSLEHTLVSSSLPPPLRGKAYLAVEPDCMGNMPSKETFPKAALAQTTSMAAGIFEAHILPGRENISVGLI